jgi:hypothetical protein
MSNRKRYNHIRDAKTLVLRMIVYTATKDTQKSFTHNKPSSTNERSEEVQSSTHKRLQTVSSPNQALPMSVHRKYQAVPMSAQRKYKAVPISVYR